MRVWIVLLCAAGALAQEDDSDDCTMLQLSTKLDLVRDFAGIAENIANSPEFLLMNTSEFQASLVNALNQGNTLTTLPRDVKQAVSLLQVGSGTGGNPFFDFPLVGARRGSIALIIVTVGLTAVTSIILIGQIVLALIFMRMYGESLDELSQEGSGNGDNIYGKEDGVDYDQDMDVEGGESRFRRLTRSAGRLVNALQRNTLVDKVRHLRALFKKSPSKSVLLQTHEYVKQHIPELQQLVGELAQPVREIGEKALNDNFEDLRNGVAMLQMLTTTQPSLPMLAEAVSNVRLGRHMNELLETVNPLLR